MSIDLALVPSSGIDRDDALLFSESQSRFVVTIPPAVKEVFRGNDEGSYLQSGGNNPCRRVY